MVRSIVVSAIATRSAHSFVLEEHRRRRRSATLAMLTLLTLLAATLLLPTVAGAVTVSPTALFIDSRTRTGTLTLYNGGSRAEEIDITFGFGYPVSDAQGNVTVTLVDVAPDGEPSAAAWMRAFPRRLVLQPGQRQTIRIMIDAPAGVADGEYWGRVLVRSRGGQPPIEQTQGGVSTQLDLETVFAVAVMYRKGTVATGIDVRDAQVELVDDGVEVTLDLVRKGNAVFLGQVRVELVDSSGKVVAEAADAVAVYRQLRRRFHIPAPAVDGPVSVRYLVDTDRPDLPAAGLLPASPVTGNKAVR